MPEVATDTSDKRNKILEAAQDLFLRYGVKRTSVDDVAREAGIAKGSVYLYFDSKAAIFAALAERLCADIVLEARSILLKTGPLVERLVDILDCYIGRPHRLVSKSPHVAELAGSKEAYAISAFDALERDMKSIIVDLLAEAGVCVDGAAEMFVAAAVGTLGAGGLGEEAYRARLAAIVTVLARGLA